MVDPNRDDILEDQNHVNMSARLPLLAWDDPGPPAFRSVQALGEGDSCICYLVKETHVLRLARHSDASAALQRETLLLPYLQSVVEIRIPNIDGKGNRIDTGERFVFYPLVPGTALDTAMFAALDKTSKRRLIRQIASFARAVHRFPVSTAASCGVPYLDPREYLPDLMARAHRVIGDDLQGAVWRYYRRLLSLYLDTPEFNRFVPSLLHGDLSPGHCLVTPRPYQLAGIIDFGDCVIGDPYWDFIFLLEDWGQEALNVFLEFYTPHFRESASTRVHIYQQFNNIEFCLRAKSNPGGIGLADAIRTLIVQATSQAVV